MNGHPSLKDKNRQILLDPSGNEKKAEIGVLKNGRALEFFRLVRAMSTLKIGLLHFDCTQEHLRKISKHAHRAIFDETF